MDEKSIWALLKGVPDPEIPVVSVVDLGIVREVAPDKVRITTTYSAARRATHRAVDPRRARLGGVPERCDRDRHVPALVDRVDQRGGAGEAAPLRIAPPDPSGAVHCPQCGSAEVEEVSRFGSTPCKSQFRCRDCLEPFDRFKCH
jgi:ring-1,2-phenylacetyl-CoA epoxidase subunit PaaD